MRIKIHIFKKIHTQFHIRYLKVWMVMLNLTFNFMGRGYLCFVCKYNERLSPKALIQLRGCKCPYILYLKLCRCGCFLVLNPNTGNIPEV